MTSYDSAFFRNRQSATIRSARHLLGVLTRELECDSVLDVGCGQGEWLSVWRDFGARTVVGIDGDYVDRQELLIPVESFVSFDLSQPFDLQRRFDLVESLEVAEHLPETSAAGFVESLIRHSELVLFSAAVKGQDGTDHINEQNYEYWRALFARHGYCPVDVVRPSLQTNQDVAFWYRYNTLLYASPEGFSKLTSSLRSRRTPSSEAIPDVAPARYKLRRALVRFTPRLLRAIESGRERLTGRAQRE